MKLMRREQRAEARAAVISLPHLAAVFVALTVLSQASRAQSGKPAGKPAPPQAPVTQTAAMRAGLMTGEPTGIPVSRDTRANVGPSRFEVASPTVRRGWPGHGPERQSAGVPGDPADRRAGYHSNSGGDSESNRRDPFRLPLPPVAAGVAGAQQPKLPRVPGKRGLVISQLRLEGTVRGSTRPANGGTVAGGSSASEGGGMIAVVTNTSKIAYFLREHDALYDGRVTRIAPDSVWFDEDYLDPEGRMRTRQVVKRIGAASDEEP